MNQRIRPIEKSLKLRVVWTLSQHDGARCGSLKIPVTNFNLITPYIRSINQPWINDEIPTSFRDIRKEGSVFRWVRDLVSGNAVVKIKQAVFFNHSKRIRCVISDLRPML